MADINNIHKNVHSNLLINLKNNWNWIFFLHNKVFQKQCPIDINCISDLCQPIAITGSNFNSSCKLTIKVDSPNALYFFNDIKPLIILSINEFFKSKIISDITIININ